MVRNTYKWREWEDNHCLHSILFVWLGWTTVYKGAEEGHQLLKKQEKATHHGCDMETPFNMGSSDVNPKEASLMEYLILFLIYIMNQSLWPAIGRRLLIRHYGPMKYKTT
jgi:hypothetical protein